MGTQRVASTEYSARAIGPGVSVADTSRVASRPPFLTVTCTEGGVLSTRNGSLTCAAVFAWPAGFDRASEASTRTRYNPSGSWVVSRAKKLSRSALASGFQADSPSPLKSRSKVRVSPFGSSASHRIERMPRT